MMKFRYARTLRGILFAVVATFGAAFGVGAENAAPSDRWLINSGEHGEQDKLTMYPVWSKLVEGLASQAKIGSVFQFSMDTTQDLVTTRGGTMAVIVGPAHIIASALRHGHYAPVGVANRSTYVVLATLKTSGIRSFAEAKGKSLGVPGQDALATYLMRGEANAAGTTLKQHFNSIYFTHFEGALLNALKFGTVDTVAVEAPMFERWRAAGEPVAEVMRTKDSPGLAIVAHKSLGKPALGVLRDAVAGRTMAVPGQPGVSFRAIEPAAYEYVSTLGYFTPRLLAGTELVSAKQAQQLAARGVPLFDGRTKEEFVADRPAGARWLPYVERSVKEADYDPSKDELDVTKLPTDKNQEIMFSCGGPECWKSYKSARRAMKEGYKRIYWFRGGIKEWIDAGLPIEKG
jgi:rhodanese-related sulfurtransferase